MALVAAALVGLVWLGFEILLLVFAGLLVSVVLRVPVEFLDARLGWPRWMAFALVLLVLLGLIVGGGYAFGARVAASVGELASGLQQAVSDVQERLQDTGWGQWLLNRVGAGQGGGGAGMGLASGLATAASSIWDVVAKAVLVFFVGVFVAANPRPYRRGFLTLVPDAQRPRADELLRALDATLKGWLLGQVVSMALIGFLIGVGLMLLGAPAAFGLGLLAGLLEFVPFVGSIIAYVPAVLLSLSDGFGMVLAVTILYVVVQQLESNVITPLVQRRAVDLPPALTIVMVFLAAALFGVVGMLVATPLLAAIMAAVKLLYVRDVLGRSVEVAGAEGAGSAARR